MTLEYIIILSFLLVLIQITIPVFISLFSKNIKLSYLFSSRDENPDTSIYENRANSENSVLAPARAASLVLQKHFRGR